MRISAFGHQPSSNDIFLLSSAFNSQLNKFKVTFLHSGTCMWPNTSTSTKWSTGPTYPCCKQKRVYFVYNIYILSKLHNFRAIGSRETFSVLHIPAEIPKQLQKHTHKINEPCEGIIKRSVQFVVCLFVFFFRSVRNKLAVGYIACI